MNIDNEAVTLPAGTVRCLLRVYNTWWHTVGTYDPGNVLISDGVTLTNIGGLLTYEDDHAMELACVEVEAHEAEIRQALADAHQMATRR